MSGAKSAGEPSEKHSAPTPMRPAFSKVDGLPRMRMLGALLSRADSSWVFKLMGPAEKVEAEITSFPPEPIVLITAVVMVLGLFVLGVVTHTLARQLGGDGAWQPTVGLSMLIMSLTDTPRLVFAMFFGGNATFVQALGWATWVAAGALLTMMVSRSHDLPWPKALGASAIQLIALLSIVKLGTF